MEAVKTNIEQEMEMASAMMVKTANGLTIKDNDDYQRGSDILKDIKAKIKAVKEYWKEPKAAAQAAHKQLVAREAQMLKPLEEAEGVIKKAMLAYDAEVKRKQREADNAQVGSVAKPNARQIEQGREGVQLSFFQLEDPVLCQIRDEILGLDIDNLTPVDALNKLNDIKKIVGGR